MYNTHQACDGSEHWLTRAYAGINFVGLKGAVGLFFYVPAHLFYSLKNWLLFPLAITALQVGVFSYFQGSVVFFPLLSDMLGNFSYLFPVSLMQPTHWYNFYPVISGNPSWQHYFWAKHPSSLQYTVRAVRGSHRQALGEMPWSSHPLCPAWVEEWASGEL